MRAADRVRISNSRGPPAFAPVISLAAGFVPCSKYIVFALCRLVTPDTRGNTSAFNLPGILKIKIFPVTMLGVISGCTLNHSADSRIRITDALPLIVEIAANRLLLHYH